MRRNKNKHQEHESLERWLVSYADFITLLFAFFVVMYSISSVNEGKYRVLSDSLTDNFRQAPSSQSVIDFQNEISNSITPKSENMITLPIPTDQEETIEINDKNPTLDEIEKEVANTVTDLINEGLVSINNNENWLEIEIKSSILFDIGGATLSEDAEDILAKLAGIIKTYPNQLQIEGYTDNVPINTLRFPSNWELSSSRAASVVHLFADEGVNPRNMQAIGYAEFRPKASNDTEEGRTQNRRVVLVVLGSDNTRKVSSVSSQRAKQIKSIENNPQQHKISKQALMDL